MFLFKLCSRKCLHCFDNRLQLIDGPTSQKMYLAWLGIVAVRCEKCGRRSLRSRLIFLKMNRYLNGKSSRQKRKHKSRKASA